MQIHSVSVEALTAISITSATNQSTVPDITTTSARFIVLAYLFAK